LLLFPRLSPPFPPRRSSDLPSPAWERVGVVPVVFGAFGMVLAGLDFWRFGWPPADRHAWWFAHMRGMLGSYIATVTAFSVVNFTDRKSTRLNSSHQIISYAV